MSFHSDIWRGTNEAQLKERTAGCCLVLPQETNRLVVRRPGCIKGIYLQGQAAVISLECTYTRLAGVLHMRQTSADVTQTDCIDMYVLICTMHPIGLH